MVELQRPIIAHFVVPVFFLALCMSHPLLGQTQLDYNFYAQTCPPLERIVMVGVWMAIKNETRMAASLLRMHFHDCFVDGCDASLLLDDTTDMTGEKNALPNRNSVKGYEVIDNIKADVEKYCPSTVSCTDILTLAARDAVLLSGGQYWPVQLGRRDGMSASEQAANQQLPSPIEPLENITAKFTSKGFDMKDVVVLSGAHTIGFAQCFTFKRRLLDFKGSGKPDPTLNSFLLQNLQNTCPSSSDGTSNSKLAPLDSVTTNQFDNMYYKNLLNNSGLLESDQALMGDSNSASMVDYYSKNPFMFTRDFAASMGCYGSVLLDDTSTFTGENNAGPNRNFVRSFEVIDNIKAKIEKFCPSTVSYADILNLAAREAVYLVHLPSFLISSCSLQSLSNSLICLIVVFLEFCSQTKQLWETLVNLAAMVNNYSKYPYLFAMDFGASMVKMGQIGVLTSKDGEMRKNCCVVN
ncbi:hypothetical protein NE237_019068 [Protea cynaroides]|uniref:peroxidase n=1 Tax=Protea cynaroides TaxID=273540 RepID=A0A9Q0KB67_9MAGN|nr:hypothetical protein NE237_019068 [Protea cynaroides]